MNSRCMETNQLNTGEKFLIFDVEIFKTKIKNKETNVNKETKQKTNKQTNKQTKQQKQTKTKSSEVIGIRPKAAEKTSESSNARKRK